MGADPITGAIAAGLAVQQKLEERQQMKKAASEQKKAAATAQNARMNQDMERRRQQIREQRVRRAQIAQSSENTGVSGSSGQVGAESAINTQVGRNISIIQSDSLAGQAITGYNQNAADAQFKAQTAGQIADLAFQGATFAAGGGFGGSADAAITGGGKTTTAKAGSPNMSPAEVKNPYNINLFE